MQKSKLPELMTRCQAATQSATVQIINFCIALYLAIVELIEGLIKMYSELIINCSPRWKAWLQLYRFPNPPLISALSLSEKSTKTKHRHLLYLFFTTILKKKITYLDVIWITYLDYLHHLHNTLCLEFCTSSFGCTFLEKLTSVLLQILLCNCPRHNDPWEGLKHEQTLQRT